MSSGGILLVPDLALERWPSMDRYAGALASRLPEVEVPTEAASISGTRYLARYVRYPRALARYHPKLVHVADHSYAHCLRAFPGVPSVVTIHDLFPMHTLARREPGLQAWVRDTLLRRVLAWLERADLVISATRFVAAETTRLLGIPAKRIRIAGYGVDDAFFAPLDQRDRGLRRAQWIEQLGRNSGKQRLIVLHVGSCAPRKNIEAIIATLAELRRRGTTNAGLVQVGGRFTSQQQHLIEVSGLSGSVIQEPIASDQDLIAAYNAANVLLLPSHYEGFGLPALEALAAGLPVVTSGVGGLAEAAGDQATVVSPPEPAALADAIESLPTDSDLRVAGAERRRFWARQFTWDRSAAEHRAVYEELLGRGGS